MNKFFGITMVVAALALSLISTGCCEGKRHCLRTHDEGEATGRCEVQQQPQEVVVPGQQVMFVPAPPLIIRQQQAQVIICQQPRPQPVVYQQQYDVQPCYQQRPYCVQQCGPQPQPVFRLDLNFGSNRGQRCRPCAPPPCGNRRPQQCPYH
jgi:hypothetical protein